MTQPSRITFTTCLLAAPILFAIVPGLFVMGGEYLARFGYVGNLSLFVSLPAWLTVFAWLAWRAVKRGEGVMRPYVMASLGANAASLILIPLILFVFEGAGADLSGKLRESFEEAQLTADAPGSELGFVSATLFAGFAAFFVGLFVMPLLAVLFGTVAKALRLERPAQ